MKRACGAARNEYIYGTNEYLGMAGSEMRQRDRERERGGELL